MIDFNKRLQSLKDRRQGTRERAILESRTFDSIAALNAELLYGRDVRAPESFEQLKESASIKYTVGAMAPVDVKSTQVSISEGNRVADNLINCLANNQVSAIKRIQGSVALDIHIKGHSDVDMLIIEGQLVDAEYPYITQYTSSSDNRSVLDIVKDIRTKSEKILLSNFPKAEVDCSGSKSIALSGGSLKRKVDIVPAIWHDSRKYQMSSQEFDRGVKIYHKNDNSLILNHPFTHIRLVNSRDSAYNGNLKCVIRLMKNMIADMPDYKKKVVKRLSSYDLAAIGYHMEEKLNLPSYFRLGLVEKTKSYLEYLCMNKSYRESLLVPDSSRKIFDSSDKTEALEILTNDMKDLSISIFKDLKPFQQYYESSVILNKYIAA